MATIDAALAAAKQQYIKATAKEKKMLEQIFGKEIFQPSIIDQVKSAQDACRILKRDYAKLFPKNLSTLLAPHEIAYREITLMIEAINFLDSNWKADWNNSNQYKYFPYFKAAPKGDKLGLGLSFYAAGFTRTGTHLGSPLVVGKDEYAEYMGKQFIKQYNALYHIA